MDYLDNLRTALTVLVVVFHTSIAYGASGSWILVDVDTSELTITSILLTLFTAVCQAFFMSLFFFLSAYFIPTSYDRKGPSRFLKDRLIRLGIPLIVYSFLIGPVTGWYAHLRGTTTLQEFYRAEVWSFKHIFVGPAWFIEALLLFAIVYVAYRLLTAKRGTASPEIPFPSGKVLLVSAVASGLVAFAVRFAYPTGEGPLGLQFGYFPLYILLFIAGLLAHRHNWLERLTAQTAKRWGRIAVLVIPVLPVGLILTGALEGNIAFEGGFNAQAILYAFWEPFVCFGIILALLRAFQTRFHASGRLRKWMSDHAYTVYLIHPPVIVFWTIVAQPLDWPQAIKWAIVSVLSVGLCFLASAAIRLIPGAKRIV